MISIYSLVRVTNYENIIGMFLSCQRSNQAICIVAEILSLVDNNTCISWFSARRLKQFGTFIHGGIYITYLVLFHQILIVFKNLPDLHSFFTIKSGATTVSGCLYIFFECKSLLCDHNSIPLFFIERSLIRQIDVC